MMKNKCNYSPHTLPKYSLVT